MEIARPSFGEPQTSTFDKCLSFVGLARLGVANAVRHNFEQNSPYFCLGSEHLLGLQGKRALVYANHTNARIHFAGKDRVVPYADILTIVETIKSICPDDPIWVIIQHDTKTTSLVKAMRTKAHMAKLNSGRLPFRVIPIDRNSKNLSQSKAQLLQKVSELPANAKILIFPTGQVDTWSDSIASIDKVKTGYIQVANQLNMPLLPCLVSPLGSHRGAHKNVRAVAFGKPQKLTDQNLLHGTQDQVRVRLRQEATQSWQNLQMLRSPDS